MIVATIQVSGVNATTTSSQTIPAGIIGARVEFQYTDPMWDGLSKTVVLKGCVTKDVVSAGDSVVIPAEVVAKPGVRVMVGVYGVDEENNIAIPTLWASIGVVKPAADPAGDESTDSTLPVWAQIEGRVSELEQNPVNTETVTGIVAQYMEENPSEPGPEGPQGPQGEKGDTGAQGPQGEKGDPGENYTLTEADKAEIVEVVLEQMPDSGGSTDQSSGMSATAANLLIEILQNAVFTSNMTGKIASLKEALGSGSGDSGNDTPDEPTVTDEITVSDGVMTIVTVGSEITVSDGVMTIA